MDAKALIGELIRVKTEGGLAFGTNRYFCDDEQLFHVNGKTYTLTNQWGGRALEAMEKLADAFPEHGISVSPVERGVPE